MADPGSRLEVGGTAAVGKLTYVSATSSVEDPTSSWKSLSPAVNVGVFGDFDFGLIDGQGQVDLNQIAPGETVTFSFTFTGTDVVQGDFIEQNEGGYLAAAKFVNGPVGNDPTEEDEDSAFGAAVPIPGSVLLLAPGLILLGALRRKFKS